MKVIASCQLRVFEHGEDVIEKKGRTVDANSGIHIVISGLLRRAMTTLYVHDLKQINELLVLVSLQFIMDTVWIQGRGNTQLFCGTRGYSGSLVWPDRHKVSENGSGIC